MKVALGTIEVDDDARKAIRRALGGKGDASRKEVKEYLLGKIDSDVIPNIDSEAKPAGYVAPEEQTPTNLPHGNPPAPVSDEELPQPSSPGSGTSSTYTGGTTSATGTAGTSPSTGDLGSAGTPGGTS